MAPIDASQTGTGPDADPSATRPSGTGCQAGTSGTHTAPVPVPRLEAPVLAAPSRFPHAAKSPSSAPVTNRADVLRDVMKDVELPLNAPKYGDIAPMKPAEVKKSPQPSWGAGAIRCRRHVEEAERTGYGGAAGVDSARTAEAAGDAGKACVAVRGNDE